MRSAIFMTIISGLTGCGPYTNSRSTVGEEVILRGPYTNDLDNQFSSVYYNGEYITFTGNGNVHRSSSTVSIVDAASRQGDLIISSPDGGLTYYWMEHIGVNNDGRLYGILHQEDHINYSDNFQTHKSVNIVYSSDSGITWTSPQPIITSPEGPINGQPTGDGDCNIFDVGDSYLYGYCLRAIDFVTIFIQAPKSDLTSWKKLYQGSFSQPGVGGLSDSLGYVGTIPAVINSSTIYNLYGSGNAVYYATTSINDGINFSNEKILFVSEYPIISAVLVNPVDGSNKITNSGLIFYVTQHDGGNWLAYRTINF